MQGGVYSHGPPAARSSGLCGGTHSVQDADGNAAVRGECLCRPTAATHGPGAVSGVTPCHCLWPFRSRMVVFLGGFCTDLSAMEGADSCARSGRVSAMRGGQKMTAAVTRCVEASPAATVAPCLPFAASACSSADVFFW